MPTAWYNKQKICKALIEAYGVQDKFIDIAECDEYYTTLSFKGKRDPSFFINTLNRLPRHHRTYEQKVEYLMKNGFWAELQNDPERLAMLLVLFVKLDDAFIVTLNAAFGAETTQMQQII